MQEQKQCDETSVNEYAALFSDNEQIVIGACVKEIKRLLATDKLDSSTINIIFDFIEIIEDCNNQNQHTLNTDNKFTIMFLLRCIQSTASSIKEFCHNENVVIHASEFILMIINNIFELTEE